MDARSGDLADEPLDDRGVPAEADGWSSGALDTTPNSDTPRDHVSEDTPDATTDTDTADVADSRDTGLRDPALREAMLDAAADAVLARGWDGLRLNAVATSAGVSRQTLYNTFGSKEGLARALTVRTTEQYLNGVETALRAHADLHNQLWAAVDYTLTKAAQDPLFKAFLLAENSETFLPLLTSDGEPVVAAARARITGVLAETHPRLDRDGLAVAGESVTRLTLSHIVLPLHPPEIVAEQIARIGHRIADPP